MKSNSGVTVKRGSTVLPFENLMNGGSLSAAKTLMLPLSYSLEWLP